MPKENDEYDNTLQSIGHSKQHEGSQNKFDVVNAYFGR
jgi:hypothetical protein